MTLDQLRAFIEVANLQHIRKASETLNLTQSAVSSSVKALEDRYGIKLFDRVGRSIFLNDAGQRFLAEAKRIMAAVKAGEALLADIADLKHGDLRIMASRTVGAYWLPQRLVKFRREFPGITLHVEIRNSEEVSDAVKSGECDIGLVERSDDLPGIAQKEIAQDEMIVVVPPNHPWANKELLATSLTQTRWILRERGSGTRRVFEQLIEANGIAIDALDIFIELPDNEAIVSALQSGDGATLISKSVVSGSLENGKLKQAGGISIRRSYYLLRNGQRYQTKAADAFETSITGKFDPVSR